MNFFTMNLNNKKNYFFCLIIYFWGGGGGGCTRVSEFSFTKNPNLKKKKKNY